MSGPRTARPDATPAITATQDWLQRVVIGLELCPFAKGVAAKGQIRWVESAATTPTALLHELAVELQALHAADPEAVDTTVLVHPQVLHDFLEFNDFLGAADALLEDLGLDGTLQIASFHPDYQFADSEQGDVANCSNRSPHPTLHLLREDSVERAVAAYPEADAIYGRNIETLRRLGWDGWRRLTQR